MGVYLYTSRPPADAQDVSAREERPPIAVGATGEPVLSRGAGGFRYHFRFMVAVRNEGGGVRRRGERLP